MYFHGKRKDLESFQFSCQIILYFIVTLSLVSFLCLDTWRREEQSLTIHLVLNTFVEPSDKKNSVQRCIDPEKVPKSNDFCNLNAFITMASFCYYSAPCLMWHFVNADDPSILLVKFHLILQSIPY